MTVQDDLNTVLNAVDRLYHYTDDRARAGLPGRSEAADDARRALARLESRLELTARAERLEKALLDIEKIGLIAHRDHPLLLPPRSQRERNGERPLDGAAPSEGVLLN